MNGSQMKIQARTRPHLHVTPVPSDVRINVPLKPDTLSVCNLLTRVLLYSRLYTTVLHAPFFLSFKVCSLFDSSLGLNGPSPVPYGDVLTLESRP